MRRVLAVLGGGLLGWSLGGGINQLLNYNQGVPIVLAGIGFGLGLGLLVAACIPSGSRRPAEVLPRNPDDLPSS